MPSTATGTIMGSVRQFLPDTISLVMTAIRATGKDRSAKTVSHSETNAEKRQAIRPRSHKAARPARGQPRTGRRPVQFGTAVRRNPAIAAITKPNSISWTCQLSGLNLLGKKALLTKTTIHSANAAAAQMPAARKNGRKPWLRKTGTAAIRSDRASLAMSHSTFGRATRQSTPTSDIRIATNRGCPRPHWK